MYELSRNHRVCEDAHDRTHAQYPFGAASLNNIQYALLILHWRNAGIMPISHPHMSTQRPDARLAQALLRLFGAPLSTVLRLTPQCSGSRLSATAHASVLRLTPMSTQDSDQVADGAPAESPASAEIAISSQPVVTGGLSKKAWVPTLLLNDNGERVQRNGNYFFALSSNDYGLAQFLFGKVNSKGHRNLPQTALVRALWKARNAAQDDFLAARHAAADGGPQAVDAEVLGDIFGAPPASSADGRGGRGGRGGRRRPSDSDARRLQARRNPEQLLAFMPSFFELTIASSQAGVATVTFFVPKARPTCLPSIELDKKVLKTFFKEVEAERDAFVGEGTDDVPRTPQRKRGQRRQSALVRSPSGESPATTKKRHVSAQIHHDKKKGRVVARWRTQEGFAEAKSFPLTDPNNSSEIASVKQAAREHARRNHFDAGTAVRLRRRASPSSATSPPAARLRQRPPAHLG